MTTSNVAERQFGKIGTAPGHRIPAWSAALHEELLAHSFLVFRDVRLDSSDALLDYARTMGEPLKYAFGSVFELKDAGDGPTGRTQLSNRPMSIHQDSVLPSTFADVIVMYCWSSPDTGGEALFCDNREFLYQLDARHPDLMDFFANARVRYLNHTENYYADAAAGTRNWIEKPTMTEHRFLNTRMPLFALNDFRDEKRNFSAVFDGVSPEESDAKMKLIDEVMRSPQVMFTHAVRPGDLIMIDNLLVSHGRNGFDSTGAPRHLSRVQVKLP